MANEFFTALPELLPAVQSAVAEAPRLVEIPSGSQSVPPTSSTVPLNATTVQVIPSETQLRALPPNSVIPPAQPQIPAVPGTAIPEVPGGTTETRYGGISSLSFLREIRPIFKYSSGAPLSAAPAVPENSLPSEAELRALANAFDSSGARQAESSMPAPSSPQIPGCCAASCDIGFF